MTGFRAGTVTFGSWKTDARVAFVRVEGGKVSAFYLAGGTSLAGPEGEITSSSATLLAYRTVNKGLAQLANQGEADSEVRLRGVVLPEEVAALDRSGRRTSESRPSAGGGGREGGLAVRTEGFRTYELYRGDGPTAAEYAAGLRRERLLAQQEEERREREATRRAFEEQYAGARESAVPGDYFVLVQAEDIAAEGGGKVRITDRKAATYGTAFLNWDKRGHWIEYDFQVEHDGYYQVALKYCREGAAQERSLMIDGEYPCEFARNMVMPGTGGWSNGADNWKLFTLSWPYLDKPYLVHLARGGHKLRLENLSGAGLNLDYIVIAAPFLELTKRRVER